MNFVLFVVIVLLLVCHANLFAQSSATLSGTVFDETGAVLPDVTVQVVNIGKNQQHQTSTNRDGYFTVPQLEPGKYTLRAHREGFTPIEIRELVLNTSDSRVLQIKMKVGSVGESVTVSAANISVDTAPSVSTTVDRNMVDKMPLNGRTFQSLLLLTPGVVTSNQDGQLSFNGQRANANYFSVDGVSANIGVPIGNAGRPFATGSTGATPGLNAWGGTQNLIGVDAMEEFKIQTSTYGAEFGRQPGGQVELTSRSGTNKFHGAVFDYLRNDAMDAQDWFNATRRIPKPAMRQNNFGATLGGPIVHDKTFFFFSYEGLRLLLPTGQQRYDVPSLWVRDDPRLLPGLKTLLNSYPVPTLPDNVNTAGTLTGSTPFYTDISNPSALDSYSVRIDQVINDRFTLFGRYVNAPSSSTAWTLNQRSPSTVQTQTLTLGLNWLISPSMNNDFRFNASRNEAHQYQELMERFGAVVPQLADIAPPFATPHSYISWVVPPNMTWPTVTGDTADNLQRQFNFVDNFSLSRGKHLFKMGMDYRAMLPVYAPQDYDLTVRFGTLTRLFSGQAQSIAITTRDQVNVKVKNTSAYVQDTWRVTPRLTLDMGTRWELNPAPKGENSGDLLTVMGADDPANMALAPAGTPIYPTSYREFAPRVGVAYQLRTASGWETIVRGGYGLYYSLGSGTAAMAATTYPHSRTRYVYNAQYPFTDAVLAPPDPVSSNPPYSYQTFVSFDPKYALPRTHQWTITLAQSLGTDQTLNVSYVGNAGRRLLRTYFLEMPTSDANFPGSRIWFTRNNGNWGDTSDYNAMQVQFTRRMAKNFQVLANYTWAHAIDTGSDDADLNAIYNNTPNTTRGTSPYDRRHAFNIALSYDLPHFSAHDGFLGLANAIFLKGWSMDSIFKVESAQPMNVYYDRGYYPTAAGSGSYRMDVVPDVPLWTNDPLAPGGRVLNYNAFALPQCAMGDPLEACHGNEARNSIRGFATSQLDFSIRRQFALSERFALQFRADLFNVLNHPNFANPDGYIGYVDDTGDNWSYWPESTTFGRSNFMLSKGYQSAPNGLSTFYQIGGPRSTQLSLRLIF